MHAEPIVLKPADQPRALNVLSGQVELSLAGPPDLHLVTRVLGMHGVTLA